MRGVSSAGLPAIARLVELTLFPSFCRTCGRLLDIPGERILCRVCLDEIVPVRTPACPCCGRFQEGLGEGHLCGACLDHPPPFSLHRSAGRYHGRLKDAVLLFKFRDGRPLGRELARIAYGALKEDTGLWWGTAAVVPVPLHRKRRRQRGYNQSEVVAKEIARLAGLPLERKALARVLHSAPQTSLDRADRAANVKGAYAAGRVSRLIGKAILLVDDVYTTGATLRECAAELKKAGVKDVRSLTIAQA